MTDTYQDNYQVFSHTQNEESMCKLFELYPPKHFIMKSFEYLLLNSRVKVELPENICSTNVALPSVNNSA